MTSSAYVPGNHLLSSEMASVRLRHSLPVGRLVGVKDIGLHEDHVQPIHNKEFQDFCDN